MGTGGSGGIRSTRWSGKKKALDPPENTPTQIQFRSIFDLPKDLAAQRFAEPRVLSPELFQLSSPSQDDPDLYAELLGGSSWDVATRYHEFKSRRSGDPALIRKLRKISAHVIVERAREIMGSIVHPLETAVSVLAELPGNAAQPEVEIEETLENSPLAALGNVALTDQDLYMSHSRHRAQPVVLSVDTSLSMTGEKLALTAVALAVVLLQFPEDPVGIVAFENEAKIVKMPRERLSISELIERFLDVPAQGYTHLESGLKAALRVVQAASVPGVSRLPSTVLLTDGKYTAGRDPSYLAPRFSHLTVIKMGHERASLELCRELASRGHGALREADALESLPRVMYGVVKDLLRGRSG